MIFEEELLQAVAKKPELLTDTWANNLRALLMNAEETEERKVRIWQALERSQTNPETRLLTGNRIVDTTTGEILPRKK